MNDQEQKYPDHDEMITFEFQDYHKPIILNVGGIDFTTSLSTLNSATFKFILEKPLYKKSSQESRGIKFYFVDRCGKYFEYILNYLRTGHLSLPLTKSDNELYNILSCICIESTFYGLPLLTKLINEELTSLIKLRDILQSTGNNTNKNLLSIYDAIHRYTRAKDLDSFDHISSNWKRALIIDDMYECQDYTWKTISSIINNFDQTGHYSAVIIASHGIDIFIAFFEQSIKCPYEFFRIESKYRVQQKDLNKFRCVQNLHEPDFQTSAKNKSFGFKQFQKGDDMEANLISFEHGEWKFGKHFISQFAIYYLDWKRKETNLTKEKPVARKKKPRAVWR